MKIKNTIAASMVVAGLGCSNAWAVLSVDVPFVVTASRHAQTADEVLVPVTVITRKDIEQSSAKDVSELLQFHAGLDIAKNGGDGTTTSLFLRGTNSSHVLVLVDGVKINSASAGGAAFQYIDPDMIERIEVIKGPRSSLYGSEALGGVVQIFTRKNLSRTKLSATAGSLGTSKLGFSTGYNKQGFDAGVVFSQYKTNGYVDNSKSSQAHGFENRSVNLRLGKQFGNSHIALKYMQAEGNNDYYGYHAQKYTNAELAQKNLNSVLSFNFNSQLNTIWNVNVILGKTKDYLTQTVSSGYFNTDRGFVDIQNDFQLSANNLLTLGVSSQDDQVDSDQYKKAASVQSVYVQDDWKAGKHHIIASVRGLKNSIYGEHSTWNIDYGYAVTKALQVNLSQGTGFKAPVFNELYYPYSGNPLLKPEVSLNKEIGLDYRFSANHKFKLSFFENNIDELISYPPPSYKPININQARISGTELNYERQSGNWLFNTSLINQNPQDLSNNKILARRAKQSLSLSLAYRGSNYQSMLNLLSSGERQDGTTTLAAYTLLNVNASWKVAKVFDIALQIDNITDAKYQTVNGYPAKPQTFYIKLSYQP